MALPPPLRALAIGDPFAPRCLEVYGCPVCPFSKKQFEGIIEHLLPLIEDPSSPYHKQLRIIWRIYGQPWHPTSNLLAEAALAVAKLAAPDPRDRNYEQRWEQLCRHDDNAYWVFLKSLYKSQEQYFDGAARGLNPDQIRANMATLAINSLGEEPRKVKGKPLIVPRDGVPLGQAIKNSLRVEKEGNAGSKVVADLKYCIKIGRQNGIHVTPTCLVDGVVDGSISSSFGANEWKEFLEKLIPNPTGVSSASS